MKLGNLFFIVLAYLLVVNVEAKIKRGEINTGKNFVYLDTFSFANAKDSVLEYEFRYPTDQCCYQLVIFDDSFGQWGSIRQNEERLTCRKKIERVDSDSNIELSLSDRKCHSETDDTGRDWLVCHDRISFQSRQRPQSNYFLTLANCGNPRKGLKNVTFALHMTNGKRGISTEFGADQKFILEMDLTFFLAYVAMTILATRFRYVLFRKRMLHLTYRLFYGSLFLKTICLLLLYVDLLRFAQTGLEKNLIQDIAEVLSCLSSIIFVTVLILVSKGYSITRARASLFGTVKMLIFDLMYAASYTLVFIDQRVLLDPRDIITSVTSLSASGVIAVKLVGCMVFVFGCVFTIKNNPAKAIFYLPFTVYFSVWFLTEPIYRLLSVYEYPILTSPNIWNGIDLVLCFGGHAYFLFITRPGSKRFPYHLRATKISFQDNDDDIDKDLENPYEPSDDFYGVFQNGKKPKRSDAPTQEDPQHFYTPVIPFDADFEECVVHDTPMAPPKATLPTVSATVSAMSYIPPTTKPLPTLSESPLKYQTTADASTVDVPKGGFGIFAVRQLKDTVVREPKEEKTLSDVNKEKHIFMTPSNGFTVLPPIKTTKGPGTAVQLTSAPMTTYRSIDETPKSKIFAGSATKVAAIGTPATDIQKVHLINVKSIDKPMKTKASGESVPALKVPTTGNPTTDTQMVHLINVTSVDKPVKTKASDESVPAFKVPTTGHPTTDTQKVHLVNVKSVDKPVKTKVSDEPVPALKVPETGIPAIDTQKAHLRNVKCIDKPVKTKASDESVPALKVPETGNPTTDIQKVHLINVKSVDKPVKTKASHEPVPGLKVPTTRNPTTDTQKVHLINVDSIDKPVKTKASDEPVPAFKVIEIENPTSGIQKVRQITVKPMDEPLRLKTSADSLSAVKLSESGNPVTGTQKVNLIDVKPVAGPLKTNVSDESVPNVTETGYQINGIVKELAPTRVDEPQQTKVEPGSLAADGGDFPKVIKKTQREPSSRRFAKPIKPSQRPDHTATDDEPRKPMDPKKKKKRLRRFLRIARRNKKIDFSKAN